MIITSYFQRSMRVVSGCRGALEVTMMRIGWVGAVGGATVQPRDGDDDADL